MAPRPNCRAHCKDLTTTPNLAPKAGAGMDTEDEDDWGKPLYVTWQGSEACVFLNPSKPNVRRSARNKNTEATAAD